MANHAHITPDAAFKSNPTQQAAGARSVDQPFEASTVADISRRAALCALPAISGFALLTATTHAAPVSEMEAAVARLEKSIAALKVVEEESWRIADRAGPFARVPLFTKSDGEVKYAYSEAEITDYMGKAAEFWGPGSASQRRLDAKLAEFQGARVARIQAENDSGLNAHLDRLEEICIAHDAAFNSLLDLPPATLVEARRKLVALTEPLARRLADCDESEASEILRSLL